MVGCTSCVVKSIQYVVPKPALLLVSGQNLLQALNSVLPFSSLFCFMYKIFEGRIAQIEFPCCVSGVATTI
jgi:hypothetical protein